ERIEVCGGVAVAAGDEGDERGMRLRKGGCEAGHSAHPFLGSGQSRTKIFSAWMTLNPMPTVMPRYLPQGCDNKKLARNETIAVSPSATLAMKRDQTKAP